MSGMRFNVLAVCTANICRSPLIELVLRERLDPQYFAVASAGVRGFVDNPMDSMVVLEAHRLGLDPSVFRSRRLTPEMIERAHLVLTAEREHRSAVLEMVPRALARTFTLREFAALSEAYPRPRLRESVTAAAKHRSTAPADVDIRDPYRRAPDVHRQVADQIEEAATRVAASLNGIVASSV